VITSLKSYQLYLLLGLALVVNFYLLATEHFFAFIFPAALLFAVIGLLATDKLLLFIVFFTPLSINMEKLEIGGVGIYLPTEPLLIGIMFLYIMRLITGELPDKKLLKHPITIAVIVYMGWILFTAFTSTMFVVSIKFFVAKLWFVIACYFFAFEIFKNPANMKRYIWLYLISLSLVMIYTIVRHKTLGFTQESAHWVMEPFYKDHTSYGAILAMFFPITIGFLFNRKYSDLFKIVIFLLILLFVVAIVLSYTRAAWVSLVAALGVFVVMKLRIDFKVLVAFVAVGAVIFALNYDNLIHTLERNRQDSSDDVAEHVQSISNVSSDASNLERLNRWSCAWRMFLDKPIVGHGPGTYQFQYATYQLMADRTIISTNFGDGGNAHSEYLGPLAESGLIGSLTMIILLIVVIYTGIRLYFQLDNPELKIIVMGALLGLITYFTHGVLNNYLDTDKASVPFWGFIAMLVAIEVHHKKSKEIKESNTEVAAE
jgi:putative inorganic carbon (hco3(-)) transporter